MKRAICNHRQEIRLGSNQPEKLPKDQPGSLAGHLRAVRPLHATHMNQQRPHTRWVEGMHHAKLLQGMRRGTRTIIG